jgi:cold-inducible RNA-binding protein
MPRIYCGNILFTATEEEVRHFFEQCGAVTSVTLMRDRETGQGRGFAWIEMPHQSEAELAIAELNGTYFQGRASAKNPATADQRTIRHTLRSIR